MTDFEQWFSDYNGKLQVMLKDRVREQRDSDWPRRDKIAMAIGLAMFDAMRDAYEAGRASVWTDGL